MRTWRKVRAELGVLARGKRNRTDALRFLVRRPALMAAVGGYETALLLSSRADTRLKTLAQLRSASMIGCPF
ncbi:MAG TPA: hypothetical protein VGR90_07365 [Acidimicrobiales bacterium]|nr:hypothetical protein [Acidimicrobiales bacterium]